MFFEHVAAPPGTWTRCGQDAWARVITRGRGCRPNRESDRAVAAAGLTTDITRFRLPRPVWSAIPCVAGVAR
jgi:hypothetical protein